MPLPKGYISKVRCSSKMKGLTKWLDDIIERYDNLGWSCITNMDDGTTVTLQFQKR